MQGDQTISCEANLRGGSQEEDGDTQEVLLELQPQNI